MGGIGTLYNSRGVVVGQAAGFYAPPDTALPGDSVTVFDSVVWLKDVVGVGAASAGNYVLKFTGGPLGSTVVPTANIAYNAAASAVKSAIDAVLAVYGVVSTVSGTAPTWNVSLDGPSASQVSTAIDGTGLTGGTPLVTPSPWTAAGATEQGWANNYAPNVQDINIEEQPTPVDQQVNTATYTFTANLSEDTVANLALALSATTTVQAPDSTHFGKTTLQLQPALPQLAVALETKNRLGFPRRYYIPRATCATNVGQNFRRAAQQHLVPVTFTSVCDLDEIEIVEITANHS